MMHKVTIKTREDGGTTVELDGQRIEAVAVGFNTGVGEQTEVTIVLAAQVEVAALVEDLRLVAEVDPFDFAARQMAETIRSGK